MVNCTEFNEMQGVEVEPEVDFELLADKTAGYSGDDITGVCRDAAMNGMRRKILGKTPEQIRYASVNTPTTHTLWQVVS